MFLLVTLLHLKNPMQLDKVFISNVLYYCNLCNDKLWRNNNLQLTCDHLSTTNFLFNELYNLTKTIPCFDLDCIRIYSPWSILVFKTFLIPEKNAKQSIKDLNEIDNLIYLNLLWVPFRDSIHERMTSYVTFENYVLRNKIEN